jgi:hypothetical protein
MSTVEQQLKESIDALMKLEPSEIEIELGRRLEATKKDLVASPTLSAAALVIPPMDSTQLAAAPVWLKELGQKFLVKLNRQMYSLVCDERDEDNAKIRAVVGSGAQQLALVMAGVLVASFGLLPGVATAVAVIVSKRLVKAGHEALCEQWKKSA